MAAVTTREQWGGRTVFIVAAISSAIGLGNIWRFPGVAYENGGGAFLLPYLVAFFTAGLPILYLDYALGHRYRAAPPLALRRLKRVLEPLGWWQVGLCYIITTYYAVVIAWAMAYTVFAVNQAWGEDAGEFFDVTFLQADAPGFSLNLVTQVLVPLVILWVLATVVMSLGLRRGLSVANRITLPLLVVLFAALVIYAVTLEGAVDGLNAFFTPSWEALRDPTVWIAAYGHIFFSFSIAFGIMLTYSSYLRRKSDLTGSGRVVAFANCGFELLAGIGVFATLGFLAAQQSTTIADLEGISGVGLAFVTFPTLLSQMPGGAVIGVVFFACLVLAGFTSLLSLLQVIVGAVQDKTGWSTTRSGVTVGVATAVPSILLFSATTGVQVLDVVDAFVNNVGVVTSAVVMLIGVAYVARATPTLRAHLNAVSSRPVGRVWSLSVRFIAPTVLLVVLVTGTTQYVRDGYGDFPSWFVVVAGWAPLGVLLVLSVLVGLGGSYRRIGADGYVPDDPEKLAQDVQAAQREQVGAGARGSAAPTLGENR